MISLYQGVMSRSDGLLDILLSRRLAKGKEHTGRVGERKGLASRPRPAGPLCWIHAASVGEAQSALILINSLLQKTKNLHILVTSGTLTSAAMLEKNLPARTFHQFYPLDHPAWTGAFLAHWHPDFVLWMESELWPNMLSQIAETNIPCLLVNARLSPVSFRNWSLFRGLASTVLKAFAGVLCQTESDATSFKKLGAHNVVVTDNLKYSAKPLSYNEDDLKALRARIGSRPCWVFASSHKGEETLALRVHEMLRAAQPELLTIIVPRHPERRDQIKQQLSDSRLEIVFRGESRILPDENTEIYIADTLSELGLFYRSAPIAFIGRTMSDDGGGGHNPIEAAQLGCAVLHGPHVQNLQDIFDDMDSSGSAILCANEGSIASALIDLFSKRHFLNEKQEAALNFAKGKERVIERVMPHIQDILMTLPALEMAR
jgi:3-deoxy-D-manno-octulosonic-acid transferase